MELYPWQTASWQRWTGMRARLPHALLLKGPQGIGKLVFAQMMARSLLCELPKADGLPCGQCPSCHWFDQGTHPDFRLLQPDALSEAEDEAAESSKKKPSRQIAVEQIRTLADFANLSAHQGGHRVVLIHPAEAMNTSAANALLKTLEEPGGNMVLILVTHKPQQLLPTILSRCVVIPMIPPSPETGEAWLRQQGVKEPGKLLARASFAPLAVAQLVEEGAATEEYARFLQQVRQPAQMDALLLAEQLQKTDPVQVVHWLQQWCYDLFSANLGGRIRYHLDQAEAIQNLAAGVAPLGLASFQKDLLTARREALHPLNPRLVFESLFIGYRQMMLGKSA